MSENHDKFGENLQQSDGDWTELAKLRPPTELVVVVELSNGQRVDGFYSDGDKPCIKVRGCDGLFWRAIVGPHPVRWRFKGPSEPVMQRTSASFLDYKVLPFDGAAGRVHGHEIRVHRPAGWCDAPQHTVAFQTYDDRSKMTLEVHVPWQQWTEYMRKAWPHGGRVVAVILENGRRIHAKGMYARYNDNSDYLAAPIVARDCIEVSTLGDGARLLEIVGVAEYLYNRTPLTCPWKRDNLKAGYAGECCAHDEGDSHAA